jgi:exodeoxyribonuclease VII large subunit
MTDDDLPLFAPRATPDSTRKPATGRPSEAPTVITVSQLNRRVRGLLEANLELMWIAGELSNVVRAASGHWYFSLKDENAQVRCVMFRTRAASVSFAPENGMQVEVRALPSLYEPRGDFQLGVEAMRRAGLGALYEAFERLKAKLAAEGLFDAAHKKPLPTFPARIGIVTSPQAAALRDVLATLKRRAPMIDVVLYPTSVQGTAAPQEIANAIDAARTRNEVEVLIVCRGGGSIEDLWAFNDERVARAIQRVRERTAMAVVSGVGHETDFTIADFVADQRAPTPTAAAELVSPLREELLANVAAYTAALRRALSRRFETWQQTLDHAARTLVSPEQRLARERERVAYMRARLATAHDAALARNTHALALLRQRLAAQHPRAQHQRALDALNARRVALHTAFQRGEDERSQRLKRLTQALALLSPLNVLERGYGIVAHRGAIVRDATTLRTNDAVSIRVAKGEIDAIVSNVTPPARDSTTDD